MIPYSNEYILQYMATLNNKNYVKGMDEMEGKTTTSTDKMGKATSVLGNKIKKLVNPANLAAAAFAYMAYRTTVAVKDFVQYEKQLSKVNTMLKVSRKELQTYGDAFVDIAIKTGKAKEEIAEGAYQALSAGVSSDALTSFMEKNTKAAIAGYTDVNTAVDGVTTVLNAYNMEITETDRVLDIFLKTQEKGKTTFGEMAQYLADVIPIAASLDVSFEEITASIATMTAAGTKTPQAITQIKSALAELSKDGQRANMVFSEISGKSFPDFIKSGGTFNQALEMMAKYAKDNNMNMLDLWSSIEAGNAALGLTGTNSERFTDNLKAMDEAAGSLEEAYKLATDNIGTEWDKLTLVLDSKWMAFVTKMETPIKVTIKTFREALEGPEDLGEPTGNRRAKYKNIPAEQVGGAYLGAQGGKRYGLVKDTDYETDGEKILPEEIKKTISKKVETPTPDPPDPPKTKEELEKERNDAIESEKKRHTLAMQEIDIKYLEDEKTNLVSLNEQLESGAITREEYDKRLENSQKDSTEAQKREYKAALEATQEFYKSQGMIAEANELEKQILEIEVQLNGLEDVDEKLKQFNEFQVKQADLETQYNNARLVREWEYLEEVASLRLTGKINQEEFDESVRDYKINQAEMDREFEITQLEALRDYYLNVTGEHEKALEVQVELDEKRREKSDEEKKSETAERKWREWAKKEEVDLQEESANAILNTYEALAKGQIKSLSDFKDFAQETYTQSKTT